MKFIKEFFKRVLVIIVFWISFPVLAVYDSVKYLFTGKSFILKTLVKAWCENFVARYQLKEKKDSEN